MSRRINAEAIAIPVIGAGIAIYLISEQLLGRFSHNTRLYVLGIGITIVVLSAINLWSALRGGDEAPRDNDVALPDTVAVEPLDTSPHDGLASPRVQLLIFLGMTVALLLSLNTVGYVVGFGAFLIAAGWVLGSRSPLVLLGFSVGGVLMIHFVFVKWLGVRLPEGLLQGIL